MNERDLWLMFAVAATVSTPDYDGVDLADKADYAAVMADHMVNEYSDRFGVPQKDGT